MAIGVLTYMHHLIVVHMKLHHITLPLMTIKTIKSCSNDFRDKLLDCYRKHACCCGPFHAEPVRSAECTIPP